MAHKYHAKTIVKPSACSSMTREMLADIDIIIPNEDELFELCSKYYPSMEHRQLPCWNVEYLL